jgi:hypothetical protein
MKYLLAALVMDLCCRPEELISARTKREFTILGEGFPGLLKHSVLGMRFSLSCWWWRGHSKNQIQRGSREIFSMYLGWVRVWFLVDPLR